MTTTDNNHQPVLSAYEQETGVYLPDEKGREHPHTMSERELLEELVITQRKVDDLVNSFFSDLKSGKINPMSLLTGGMFGKRG